MIGKRPAVDTTEPTEHLVTVTGALEIVDADGAELHPFHRTVTMSEAEQDIALTLVQFDGTEIDVRGALQQDGVVTLTLALETEWGDEVRAWTTVVPLAVTDRFSVLLGDDDGFARARGSIEHALHSSAPGTSGSVHASEPGDAEGDRVMTDPAPF